MAGVLPCDPLIDLLLEEIHGQGAGVEDCLIEGAQAELWTEGLFGLSAELGELDFSDGGGEGLGGLGDYVVDAFHCFRDSIVGIGQHGVRKDIIDGLLPRPVQSVDAGVGDGESGVVTVELKQAESLVWAGGYAGCFDVERPSIHERPVAGVAAEWRQRGRHGRKRVFIDVRQILRGIGLEAIVAGDRLVERAQVCKAELLREGEHGGFVLRNLMDGELVHLLRSERGGGALSDEEGVVSVSGGDGPEARVGAACGDVGSAEEEAEAQVGGLDLGADNGEDFVADEFTVGGGDGSRETLERRGVGRVGGLGVCDGVDQREHLLDGGLRGDTAFLNAEGGGVGGLLDGGRQLAEAGCVVVVVSDRGKAELRERADEINLRAAVGRDGHLPGLVLGGLLLRDEVADGERVTEGFLGAHAGGVDDAEAQEVLPSAVDSGIVGGDGVVGKVGVVAVVSKGGGELGMAGEAVLPELREDVIERGAAVGEGLRRRRHGWIGGEGSGIGGLLRGLALDGLGEGLGTGERRKRERNRKEDDEEFLHYLYL